jgi:hypothetical protein
MEAAAAAAMDGCDGFVCAPFGLLWKIKFISRGLARGNLERPSVGKCDAMGILLSEEAARAVKIPKHSSEVHIFVEHCISMLAYKASEIFRHSGLIQISSRTIRV